jgi:hypothetical protein
MEATLGANVYVDDPQGRLMEAGFGLVRSERIRCTFEPSGPASTRVRIEALFPAGAEIPERSAAVEALAQAISSNPV